ncbi:MAG: hypothetical protein HKN32_05130, partial [Flavobacteriales bacterium]|nr:hypothetical protein [Flavobacteriales bacterium]
MDVLESSSCLVCDGEASYSTPDLSVITFSWFSADFTLLFQETNSTGSSQLQGLCPGVYYLEINSAGDIEQIPFGIGTVLNSAGEFEYTIICSAAPEFSLFDILNAQNQSGQWSDPNNFPISDWNDPEGMQSGLYSYTVTELGCTVESGIWIDVAEQADPGLTTTYLICENYEPFSMTEILAGSPDPGGQWYGPQQDEIGEIFDPETMDTGLFTYQIDTVEGCPAIYSTIYVIENGLPDPGISTTIYICPNALPFDLTASLQGTPEIDGIWYDDEGDEVSNVFDPMVSAAGIYTYEVDGQTPCPNQESVLNVEFTAGIDAGEDGALTVCEIDGPIDFSAALNGTPDDGGFWTDSNGDPVEDLPDASAISTGSYTYTVSAIGCQDVSAQLSLAVEPLPNAGEDSQLSLCEELSIFNLGQALTG